MKCMHLRSEEFSFFLKSIFKYSLIKAPNLKTICGTRGWELEQALPLDLSLINLMNFPFGLDSKLLQRSLIKQSTSTNFNLC